MEALAVRTLAHETTDWGYAAYDARWIDAARAGARRSLALDTRLVGWRYLSLNALLLAPAELASLRGLTPRFGRLLDWATAGVLADPDWWPALSWPWPAIELARQEPAHPGGAATLYGRFDWLQDAASGDWRLVEYNADTPSGGREVHGLDPAVLALHPGQNLALIGRGPRHRLTASVQQRLRAHEAASRRPVRLVGVVSTHGWLEDMAQAWWLAELLRRDGQPAIVGDVRDLDVSRRRVTLRGRPIDALYRFYPFEQFYRHGLFAPVMECALDGRVLLLNGLRGFLAQSKSTLAWLWAHRAEAVPGGSASTRLIERHLPATFRAQDPAAERLLADGVVKHANGREGAQVVFGDALAANPAAWEARLLEGGYVVQRRITPVVVEDVAVDELGRALAVATPRYACVGAFCIGGRFGGCYSRLDGPITTSRATYVPTLLERGQAG